MIYPDLPIVPDLRRGLVLFNEIRCLVDSPKVEKFSPEGFKERGWAYDLPCGFRPILPSLRSLAHPVFHSPTEVIMLVLSRYRDESIYIGDDVVVTIVDIRGDRVRLGIQAPPNVSVHRQEIYNAIVEGKEVPPGGSKKTLESKSPNPSEPMKATGRQLPLEAKLAARKSKGLPIDLGDSPLGFGGISEMIK